MNLRINTHRNVVWNVDSPSCEKHFQNPGHKFNEHAKFTIIEKIKNVYLSPNNKYKVFWNTEKILGHLKVVSVTFLLVCFACLKESTCETRRNVFNFTSKVLFVLEIIKF